jgi:hypothetical protein
MCVIFLIAEGRLPGIITPVSLADDKEKMSACENARSVPDTNGLRGRQSAERPVCGYSRFA